MSYTDDYREALQQVIDAKVEGREVIETPQAEPTSGTVVDLMAALRASVEAAKASRGESGAAAPEKTAAAEDRFGEDCGGHQGIEQGAAGQESAAKKAPARKTAAAKAPAKKTAAKATKAATSARKAATRRRSA